MITNNFYSYSISIQPLYSYHHFISHYNYQSLTLINYSLFVSYSISFILSLLLSLFIFYYFYRMALIIFLHSFSITLLHIELLIFSSIQSAYLSLVLHINLSTFCFPLNHKSLVHKITIHISQSPYHQLEHSYTSQSLMYNNMVNLSIYEQLLLHNLILIDHHFYLYLTFASC